jgi:peptidoglycan/LPS O-acetylase OafA/YrhL
MADRSVDYHRWIWFTGWDFVACILAAPALLYAARPVIGRGLGPVYRSMRWLGQRSYGLYLWHFPIILSLYGRGPLERAPDLRAWGIKVPAILALSLLAASASWRAVERPAQEFARRGARMPTTPAVQEFAP